MALKVLFVLAILKLALSHPYPDPGQNIHINVEQVVNGGGCCPEPEPPEPEPVGLVQENAEGCDCHYVLSNSGCVIKDPAPVNKACKCSVVWFDCDGEVVDCIRPSESSCTEPDTSLASCLQADGGDCDGY